MSIERPLELLYAAKNDCGRKRLDSEDPAAAGERRCALDVLTPEKITCERTALRMHSGGLPLLRGIRRPAGLGPKSLLR